MKLRVMKVLLIVLFIAEMIAVAFCDGMHDDLVVKSSQSLAEAKTILSEQLQVNPGEIVVYRNVEYDFGCQYRWRHSEEATINTDNHVDCVQPEVNDLVIRDERVKQLIDEAIEYDNKSMKWEAVAILMVAVAVVTIPIALL